MKEDLLDADASVRWAESNFPAFDARIQAWIQDNVYVEVKEPHANSPNNLVVAVQKEPLPLIFNAEVGAYLNAIRSSLDLLASAIGRRHGILRPDQIYFPVAHSADAFRLGNYKGAHFVKNLPASERQIIETLQPYRGGHDFIWPLHNLDIERKHRRLLAVSINPARLRIFWKGRQGNFIPISTGWMRADEHETVMGLLPVDGPQPDLQFSAQISFPEWSVLEDMPIILALNHFANLADTIIKSFDF